MEGKSTTFVFCSLSSDIPITSFFFSTFSRGFFFFVTCNTTLHDGLCIPRQPTPCYSKRLGMDGPHHDSEWLLRNGHDFALALCKAERKGKRSKVAEED